MSVLGYDGASANAVPEIGARWMTIDVHVQLRGMQDMRSTYSPTSTGASSTCRCGRQNRRGKFAVNAASKGRFRPESRGFWTLEPSRLFIQGRLREICSVYGLNGLVQLSMIIILVTVDMYGACQRSEQLCDFIHRAVIQFRWRAVK